MKRRPTKKQPTETIVSTEHGTGDEAASVVTMNTPIVESAPTVVESVVVEEWSPSNVSRCINCGQVDHPIEVRGKSYYCPECHYQWHEIEEQAPFRRVQRGEL